MSPERARLPLAALTILIIAAILLPPGRIATVDGDDGSRQDMDLHVATISRLADGEPYYPVVGQELRKRTFPTGSIFNWRTPLFYTAIALSPPLWRLVLYGLAVLVLAVTVKALSQSPPAAVIVGAVAQSGALAVVADDTAWMFHEVWAGFFIALSAFAYASRRWQSGATLAVGALFIRELAAPYVFLCAVSAVWSRRRRETVVLLIGVALYTLYYLRHAANVRAEQNPEDVSHAASWMQFGGVEFILTTLRTSNLLHEMPVAILAGVLILILAGVLSSTTPFHLRGTAAVYVGFFAVAGQPFNWYWGWMYGLVVPIVAAHGVVLIESILSGMMGRTEDPRNHKVSATTNRKESAACGRPQEDDW